MSNKNFSDRDTSTKQLFALQDRKDQRMRDED